MMQPSQRWEWWLGGLLVILTAVVVPLLVLLGGSPSASGQTSGQTTVGATIHPAGNFPVAGAGDVWLSAGFSTHNIAGLSAGQSVESNMAAIAAYLADLNALPQRRQQRRIFDPRQQRPGMGSATGARNRSNHGGRRN